MQHRIGWILTTALIVGCNAQSPSDKAAGTPPASASTTANAAPTIGIDLAGIDKSVKPGDDFDAYANGAWRKTTEIPADRASIGTGFYVFEKAEKRNAELIQDAAQGQPGRRHRRAQDRRLLRRLHGRGRRSRSAAWQPLEAGPGKAIDAIADTKPGCRARSARRLRADVDPLNATNFDTEHLFGLFVAQGLTRPEHATCAYLLQGGLGMPEPRVLPRRRQGHGRTTATQYQAYIATMLEARRHRRMRTPKAKAIFDAGNEDRQGARQRRRQPATCTRPTTPGRWRDFAKKAPGIDWAAFFDGRRPVAASRSIVAWQPDAITKLSALVASEPLQTWKDYLRFHAINHGAGLLPKAYADLRLRLLRPRAAGHAEAARPLEARASARPTTRSATPSARSTSKQYFPASSKAQVEEMVKNILAAFGERIDKLDWMTPATQGEGQGQGRRRCSVGVGYPDTWRDYAALEIRADDALGNRLRAELFEYRHQLAKLGKPVDRGEWWMTPQTVNAVNLPLQNALNFPAAILEAAVLRPEGRRRRQLRRDRCGDRPRDQPQLRRHGRRVRRRRHACATGGRRKTWPTSRRVRPALVAQYDAYEPLPGLHLNGKQTLGENIADVAGLAAALRRPTASRSAARKRR